MGAADARIRRGRVIDGVPIRPAATLILIRDRDIAPSVLMGQRGAGAAFMPGKFVFPGGAVDAGDATALPDRALPFPCRGRLAHETAPDLVRALPAAAIRELYEETGLILGRPKTWPTPPAGWHGFAATGHRPDATRLQFVFRAVTPVGRPHRFDARFFLADAASVANDPDDFSGAEDELNHLQWVPLAEARRFDLPFITQVVLAEITARAADPAPPPHVPFFRNDDEANLVNQLGGASPI